MKFSVYNYTTHQYDVYDGSGPMGAHAGAPPVALGGLGRSSMGSTPEQASWRVPSGAIKIGTSSMPQGRIASMGGSALGAAPDTGNIMRMAVYALGAYALWKALR